MVSKFVFKNYGNIKEEGKKAKTIMRNKKKDKRKFLFDILFICYVL